ncbi:hypothetical protein ANN_23192 [Periplaneta americana]|uniref:Uncharacterized protein n=1 Tax=Periplaneta americana TaxID=6978 RepID=A0ABQ8SLC3_PERAM|nr:hypothetical protein ANN_23192 [Periplaneta americana]
MAGLCEGGNEPPGSLKASMVLFRVSERPLTALDNGAPRLLRMAPLRHSLRVSSQLDAQDCDDTTSTLSAPGYGEEHDAASKVSQSDVLTVTPQRWTEKLVGKG